MESIPKQLARLCVKLRIKEIVFKSEANIPQAWIDYLESSGEVIVSSEILPPGK